VNRPEILAVHKQKLEEFLRKLGLWAPLLEGQLKCHICGVTISSDNIGFIIPSGNDILFCCSNAECMFKIKDMQSGASKNAE
jgi:hypothetical protein